MSQSRPLNVDIEILAVEPHAKIPEDVNAYCGRQVALVVVLINHLH